MRCALAMLLTLALTGCSQTMGIAETKAVCAVWSDISWSRKDTPQTVAEVKVNNARRAGYCG